MMGLARSSFYYAPVVEKVSSQEEVALVEKIKQIQEKFPLYGYRRLVAVLKRQGQCINHKKMKCILKIHDLSPKPLYPSSCEHNQFISWLRGVSKPTCGQSHRWDQSGVGL